MTYINIMNIRIFVISLIISALVLSSCGEKSIEDDLVGTWHQISLGGSHLKGQDVLWTFAADHTLYRDIDNEVDTAQWFVEANFGKNHLMIQNLDPASFDGTHLIHSLGSTMELQRIELPNGEEGGFWWSEFEKQ